MRVGSSRIAPCNEESFRDIVRVAVYSHVRHALPRVNSLEPHQDHSGGRYDATANVEEGVNVV